MHNYLTVEQAAQELSVSRQRVQQFIRTGRLQAERFGQRVLMIERAEVERFKAIGRKPGRPAEP